LIFVRKKYSARSTISAMLMTLRINSTHMTHSAPTYVKRRNRFVSMNTLFHA